MEFLVLFSFPFSRVIYWQSEYEFYQGDACNLQAKEQVLSIMMKNVASTKRT